MKRVLLIVDDRLLANFHREKLEQRGFAVETARQAESGLKIIIEKKPDLVLLDLVLPGFEGTQLISQIRASNPDVPLFVFGSTPRDAARMAEKMGATKVLPKTEDPGSQVLAVVETMLGEQPGRPAADGQEFSAAQSAKSWLKSSLEANAESIASMRRDLHALARNARDINAIQDLYRNAHFVSDRTALVGLLPIFKLTSAIEALIYGLYKMPDEINPSVLRTLGQSIDFLAASLSEENLLRVKETNSAKVFAVDDDEQGREMISAAMEMANLSVKVSESPKAALAVLEVEPFNLIFLDIGLPDMSGFELCTRVRNIPLHRATPIVFLTGLATFQNRVQGSLSGGNDFIAKPFNLHELGLKALLWIMKAQLGL